MPDTLYSTPTGSRRGSTRRDEPVRRQLCSGASNAVLELWYARQISGTCAKSLSPDRSRGDILVLRTLALKPVAASI
jgi:hypothetical protein